MTKKSLFAVAISLFCVFTLAQAGDILWSSITNYTSTKANKTVPISPVEPIKAITTASTCTAYLSTATGTGVLMAANTWYDIRVPGNISNIVFKCDSSAGTTVTVIK
jgi:hypothetical protein